MNLQKRSDGRLPDQLRNVRIIRDVYGYAASSVLFELGNTKVLCAVNLQNGVPPFLRGKKTGWLNAEYAMLPSSTQTRTLREITQMKRSGRSLEISRLISRTLRTVVDLSILGEQTITVDCDVLQADGGTRVASINGAYCALALAQERWLNSGIISHPFLLDSIAAVSVGINNKQIVLDPDYAEDSVMEADFNLVVTGSGALIEIQGGAERTPIAWDQFDQLKKIALSGTASLFNIVQQEVAADVVPPIIPLKENKFAEPMFSLKNRLSLSE